MSNETRPLSIRLRKKYAFLVREIIVDNYVAELYGAFVLSIEDKSRIRSLTGSRQKEEFVETLMHKNEPAILKFLHIARRSDQQPQIYNEIMSLSEDEEEKQHETGRQNGTSDHEGGSSGIERRPIPNPRLARELSVLLFVWIVDNYATFLYVLACYVRIFGYKCLFIA